MPTTVITEEFLDAALKAENAQGTLLEEAQDAVDADANP